MPYNSSGVYSLPSGPRPASGQTALASQVNTPVDDIAAALSQTFLRDGRVPMSGDITLFRDGTSPLHAVTKQQLDTKIQSAASRSAVKALPTSFGIAILTEDGREGMFKWVSGDFSAQVSADAAEGIYIKSDSALSSSGAWVRQFSGPADARWFGVVADGVTDSTTAVQGAINAYNDIIFPAGDIVISQVSVTKSYQRLSGAFARTRFLSNSTTLDIFLVGQSGGASIVGASFERFHVWATVVKTSGHVFRCWRTDQCHWRGVHAGDYADYVANANTHRLYRGWYMQGFSRCSIDRDCVVTVSEHGVICFGETGQNWGAEIEIDADFLFCGGRAVFVGGSAGGVYVNGEISRCSSGVVADATITGEPNREIFVLSRGIIDSCDHYAVAILDNGASLLELNACWLTSTGRFSPAAAGSGLYIAPSAGAQCEVKVSGVNFYNNNKYGADVQAGNLKCSGSIFRDIAGVGVRLGAANANETIVTGCSFHDIASHGVEIAASMTAFSITENEFIRCGGSIISAGAGFGADKVIRDNRGYATEAFGYATTGTSDASGDVTVTHGLVTNPTMVTPRCINAVTGFTCQAHSITSTTFKIRFYSGASPIAGGLTVAYVWDAAVV